MRRILGFSYRELPGCHRAVVTELLDMYNRGLIHRRFALKDAPAAIDQLSTRGLVGKVVVTISDVPGPGGCP